MNSIASAPSYGEFLKTFELSTPSSPLLIVERAEDRAEIAYVFGDGLWNSVSADRLIQHRDAMWLLSPAWIVYFIPSFLLTLENDSDLSADTLYDNTFSLLTPPENEQVPSVKRDTWALIDRMNRNKKNLVSRTLLMIQRRQQDVEDLSQLTKYWAPYSL